MAKGKNRGQTTEVVETQEEVKTTEVVETSIDTKEPRNFPVFMRETKELKVIRKSEYDTNIHVAI